MVGLESRPQKRPVTCGSSQQIKAFRLLAMEQKRAFEAEPGEDCGGLYGQIQADARLFLPLLASDPVAARVFSSRERNALIEKLCGQQQSASTELDLLASFSGDWVGSWWQDGVLSQWWQHWHGPGPLEQEEGVWVQPVLIHRQGAREPTVAMNAMVPNKSMMMGVVGVNGGRGARPHVGVDLGQGRLGWIAMEGSKQEMIHYSIFVEWLEAGCYMIKGVDFRWQPNTQTLHSVRPKGGLYTRPKAKSWLCAKVPR